MALTRTLRLKSGAYLLAINTELWEQKFHIQESSALQLYTAACMLRGSCDGWRGLTVTVVVADAAVVIVAGGLGGLSFACAFVGVARGLVEDQGELARQVGFQKVVVVAAAPIGTLALHNQLDRSVHNVWQHIRQSRIVWR